MCVGGLGEQTTLKSFPGDHYFIFDPKYVKPVCEYLSQVMNGEA